MTISIYSPEVRATAQADGTTELQAYRKLRARDDVLKSLARERKANNIVSRSRPGFLERIFNVSPDWNDY